MPINGKYRTLAEKKEIIGHFMFHVSVGQKGLPGGTRESGASLELKKSDLGWRCRFWSSHTSVKGLGRACGIYKQV